MIRVPVSATVEKMKSRISHCLTLSLVAILAACSQDTTIEQDAAEKGDSSTEVTDILATGLALVGREGIEGHLRYLADDARQGRMTGQSLTRARGRRFWRARAGPR